MSLTPEEKSFYGQNGYLVIQDAVSAAILDDLKAVIAEFKEKTKSVSISNEKFDVAPGHSAETPMLRRLKDPVLRHPAFDELMRSEAIVGAVADLLGGTVRFDHSKLNFKPAGAQARIEWHQDWAFYPHTNDDLLAVGVMIEDCTEENGPLMVIPGSHRGPVYDHHQEGLFVGGVRPDELGAQIDRAVSLIAAAGSISIHHVRTLHASGNNRSQNERPLLLYSYSAVDAFPVFEACDIAEYDSRILRGTPTRAPRATGVPMRVPVPRRAGNDGIFDDQATLKVA